MRPVVLLLALVGALAAPHTASAGCAPWCSPSSDVEPRWSADGTKLAYSSGPGGVILSVIVAAADGSAATKLPDIHSPRQLSPDFRRAAFYTGGGDNGTNLSVADVGGPAGVIATASPTFPRVLPQWSPDGTQIAFSGQSLDVEVVNADGSGRHRVLDLAAESLAWSPDGRKLALGVPGAAPTLWVVDANGTNAHEVMTQTSSLAEAWSPDGTTLAFIAGSSDALPPTLNVVLPDGTEKQLGSVTPSYLADGDPPPAWAPDGRHIAYETPAGLAVFDVEGGVAPAIADGSNPAWSPDGRTIAYRDTGPCSDRSGIALVAPDGSNWRKLTNDCRIFGTPGSDFVEGSDLVDVVFAGDGNDVVDARGGDDTIYGGRGNDHIVGGAGVDTIYGGPGDDVLEGNIIFGGSGHDRIRVAGDWPAYIYAVDGERDVISCGRARRDVVYADPIDRVGPSCERVFRR